ncbi:hypothetical protein [Actinomadura rudentiformis]|uniref:Uncharacterized protein n=1 Tax=Actinomadura rudentiformis TaxID=359158 RepID=A0A6H9YGY7_9ACTN|nr:hypothetical protein [Actinomadura rudentiformis]KAB2339801.1 hypothetical protein F8566_46890 [Actinomadura rudentiformis]
MAPFGSDMAPDPHHATTPQDLVEQLRLLKAWSGLTYRQLQRQAAREAEILPYSTIASVLRRTALPRLEFVRVYVRACGVAPERVTEWVTAWRRIAMGEAELCPDAGRISELDLRRLAASTLRLRRLEDRYGGGAVADQAIAVQERWRERVDGAPARALRLVAEDAVSAGVISFSAGRDVAAERLGRAGLEMARAAAAVDVEIYALSHQVARECEAGRLGGTGRLGEAVAMARRAQSLGKGVMAPRVLSLLAAQEAMCLAAAGDGAGFWRAMQTGLEWFVRGTDGCPDWCEWFDEGGMLAANAAASEAFHRWDVAAACYEKALERSAVRYGRDRLRHRLRLALCLLATGEVEQACHHGALCLPDVAEVADVRVDQLVTVLRRELSGIRCAAAADFADRCDDLFEGTPERPGDVDGVRDLIITPGTRSART